MLKKCRNALTGGLLLVSAIAPLSASGAVASVPLARVSEPNASSPDQVGQENGRIAFSTGFILFNPDLSGHSQVYTVNPDGTDEKQLTHVPIGSQAGDPAYSPDGTQILYVSNVSGNFAVWVMKGDGTNQHVLVGEAGWDYFTPVWSPDGTKVAVSRCNATYGFEIYCDLDVMSADGTGRHALVGGHHFNADPAYSATGAEIAFDSDRAGLQSAIWVVNVQTGRLSQLTGPTAEAFAPQWSPTTDQILYANNCCDGVAAQIRVMRSDGTHVQHLTDLGDGHGCLFASYSPDGTQIVLACDLMRKPGQYFDIYTMNSDGSDLTRIIAHHRRAVLSDWGPATSASSTDNAATR